MKETRVWNENLEEVKGLIKFYESLGWKCKGKTFKENGAYVQKFKKKEEMEQDNPTGNKTWMQAESNWIEAETLNTNKK